jgi:uncharacterized protein YbcI
MSTSLLYHMFGIRGYEYHRVDYYDGSACFTIEQRDLLKQVRTHLIKTSNPSLQSMVQAITGVQVVSLHHDISTVTGEAIIFFTLAESPLFRQAKR